MIQWTIQAAKSSGVIDLIVVTSDDCDVIQISKKSEVLTIDRPSELASDSATTFDVVLHALTEINRLNYKPKKIMLLQPTSPLRSAVDIVGVFNALNLKSADGIVTVCKVDHPIQWCNVLPKDKSMKNFLKKQFLDLRSQDFEINYRLNGAIYFSTIKSFLKNSGFMGGSTFAYEMPRERSVDIDEEYDYWVSKALVVEMGVACE